MLCLPKNTKRNRVDIEDLPNEFLTVSVVEDGRFGKDLGIGFPYFRLFHFKRVPKGRHKVWKLTFLTQKPTVSSMEEVLIMAKILGLELFDIPWFENQSGMDDDWVNFVWEGSLSYYHVKIWRVVS